MKSAISKEIAPSQILLAGRVVRAMIDLDNLGLRFLMNALKLGKRFRHSDVQRHGFVNMVRIVFESGIDQQALDPGAGCGFVGAV